MMIEKAMHDHVITDQQNPTQKISQKLKKKKKKKPKTPKIENLGHKNA